MAELKPAIPGSTRFVKAQGSDVSCHVNFICQESVHIHEPEEGRDIHVSRTSYFHSRLPSTRLSSTTPTATSRDACFAQTIQNLFKSEIENTLRDFDL